MAGRELIRRLAAIVVADVVGYSGLMEDDESGTLRSLQSIHADIVDPITARYRGRIVKSTGDGWLAEFSSVTDAVRSSLDIQESLAMGSLGVGPSQRLQLRIGVNLGEIIFDGNDIHGTGVNVAARLESIAEPGSVVISLAVREQLRGVSDLSYEDLGERIVKNLSQPVRAFKVRGTEPIGRHSERGSKSASGGAPDHASVAVLPFSNLSGDPDQEYFADGMVDDIITALSRFKWLRVIARNSTFVYKGQAVDVRQIGKDLDVRYVLEGSVRKSNRRVRLTAQLIEATTGGHVWADNFSCDLDDIFDVQDRIAERVIGTMEPQLRKAEIERARRKPPENLDAYDLFLRALPHVYAMRPEDNSKALELLAASVRLDPTFAPPLAFMAWCYEQRLTRRWHTVLEDDATNCIRLARRALNEVVDDANAIALAGFVLIMVAHDHDAGLVALRRAVALNPNNAFVAMLAGWGHNFAGDLDEALNLFNRAHDLSPNDPAAFYVLTGLAMAHLLACRFDEAARMASDSFGLYSEWDSTIYVLTAAQAHLGRLGEARSGVAKLAELHPGASISLYESMLPIRYPERFRIVAEGLRLAGLPE